MKPFQNKHKTLKTILKRCSHCSRITSTRGHMAHAVQERAILMEWHAKWKNKLVSVASTKGDGGKWKGKRVFGEGHPCSSSSSLRASVSRWPLAPWKEARCHSSPGKRKQNPRWDITSQLSEWPSSKRQEITSVGEDVEKGEALGTASGNVNWRSHYGKQYGGPSKKLKMEVPYNPAIPLSDTYPKKMKILIW